MSLIYLLISQNEFLISIIDFAISYPKYDTIRYDTIEEINVDSKAEYTVYTRARN